MDEKDILKFQRELVEIKNNLLTGEQRQTEHCERERFAIATKIDLTVSRLMRLLESKK